MQGGMALVWREENRMGERKRWDNGQDWEHLMSLPQPKSPEFTIEHWQTWEGRWELIDGEAYDMTPAPSLEHQRSSGRIFMAINLALREAKRKSGGGECEVFAAPVDLFLLDTNVLQPDLVVACDPAKKTARGIEGAPDLVIEILSPATAKKDLSTKRWLYEAAGIPEYLIVYPEERCTELLCLENGRYQTSARIPWNAAVTLLDGKISVALGEES
jgi:Uma2 family endonuclease